MAKDRLFGALAIVLLPFAAFACGGPPTASVPPTIPVASGTPPRPAAPAPPPVVIEAPPSKIHEACAASAGARTSSRLRLSTSESSIRLEGNAPHEFAFELRNDSDEPSAFSLHDDGQGTLTVDVTIGATTHEQAVSLRERDPHAPVCTNGTRILTLDPHATVSWLMTLSAVRHVPRNCTCSPDGLCAMHAAYDEPMKKGTHKLVLRDATGAPLAFDRSLKVEVATTAKHATDTPKKP